MSCAQTHLGANKAPCIGVLDHAYRVFDDAYRASKQRKDFSNGFHPCGGIGKFVVDERVVDRRIDEPWADSMTTNDDAVGKDLMAKSAKHSVRQKLVVPFKSHTKQLWCTESDKILLFHPRATRFIIPVFIIPLAGG